MGERRGEANQTCLFVDCGRLDGRDLMAAERLAHDVETAGQSRVAKRLIVLPWMKAANGGDERLFRIGELRLRLGQRGGDRPNRFARLLHGSPPSRGDRS